uniref:50S ribosomal protein L14 n=1 Tax=Nannochloropsis limnetica TaxID=120807 RepID=A0A890CL19_9STRA|nr:50S ribosomal protein L14 [Nannochloropsis limnetica]QRG32586.1 50S ribosomal protein L14 [Nannochloropsis limnetica]
MIQTETLLRVTDNSGAKKVKCIKVLGGFRRKLANLGDLIVVSIRRVKQHKKKKIKVKEGEVVHALVVRTKAKLARQNSTQLQCQENSVVLMTNKNKPFATRVLGPVPRALRHSKFMKVASLSAGFI